MNHKELYKLFWEKAEEHLAEASQLRADQPGHVDHLRQALYCGRMWYYHLMLSDGHDPIETARTIMEAELDRGNNPHDEGIFVWMFG